MGKKTKQQLAKEKRIAKLKKEEKKLERESSALNRKLERERAKGQREIDALEKQIEKLQAKLDAIFDRALPSQKKFDKVEDKLLKVRNTVRGLLPEPPPSDAKRRDPDEEE
jgi:hypothetical protein